MINSSTSVEVHLSNGSVLATKLPCSDKLLRRLVSAADSNGVPVDTEPVALPLTKGETVHYARFSPSSVVAVVMSPDDVPLDQLSAVSNVVWKVVLDDFLEHESHACLLAGLEAAVRHPEQSDFDFASYQPFVATAFERHVRSNRIRLSRDPARENTLNLELRLLGDMDEDELILSKTDPTAGMNFALVLYSGPLENPNTVFVVGDSESSFRDAVEFRSNRAVFSRSAPISIGTRLPSTARRQSVFVLSGVVL